MKGLWPIAIGVGLAAYLYYKETKRSALEPPAHEIAKVLTNVKAGSPVLRVVAKGIVREWFSQGLVPSPSAIKQIYVALFSRQPTGGTLWQWKQIAFNVGALSPSIGSWPTADAATDRAATWFNSLNLPFGS